MFVILTVGADLRYAGAAVADGRGGQPCGALWDSHSQGLQGAYLTFGFNSMLGNDSGYVWAAPRH